MATEQVDGLLVAVDGSDPSLLAVDWAATESVASGRSLALCHVVDTRPMVDLPMPPDLLGELDKRAEQVLDRAVVRAHRAHPALLCTRLVRHGEPAQELAAAADLAEATVLGSRGSSRFAALLLGSVSSEVSAHANNPVVVVHPTAHRTGPVLIGVDGSDRSAHALEWGFDYAARHQLGVQAMHVFPDPMGTPSLGLPSNADHGRAREIAERYLAQAVAPLADRYPEVAVDEGACGGSAARALVDASRGASLLVVGHRGHGGFTGLLLGSVSQTVLRHAHCPVAVIR